MVKLRPIQFNLSAEEQEVLQQQTEAAGYRSPSLFMRALYRESLQTPENLRRTAIHAELMGVMCKRAAHFIVEHLKTISPEELLGEGD